MYIWTGHGHISALLSLKEQCHVTFHPVKTTWCKVVKVYLNTAEFLGSLFQFVIKFMDTHLVWVNVRICSILFYHAIHSIFSSSLCTSRALFSSSCFCKSSCRGEWRRGPNPNPNPNSEKFELWFTDLSIVYLHTNSKYFTNCLRIVFFWSACSCSATSTLFCICTVWQIIAAIYVYGFITTKLHYSHNATGCTETLDLAVPSFHWQNEHLLHWPRLVLPADSGLEETAFLHSPSLSINTQ